MFTIPTDDLYKFIAFFGLSLVIAGFSLSYIEYGMYRKSENDLIKINTEIEIKSKLLELSLSEHRKSLEKLEQRTSYGANVNESDVKSMLEISNGYKKVSEEMENLTTSTLPKISGLINNKKHSWYSFIAFTILIVFGTLLSIFGFYKWNKNT